MKNKNCAIKLPQINGAIPSKCLLVSLAKRVLIKLTHPPKVAKASQEYAHTAPTMGAG